MTLSVFDEALIEVSSQHRWHCEAAHQAECSMLRFFYCWSIKLTFFLDTTSELPFVKHSNRYAFPKTVIEITPPFFFVHSLWLLWQHLTWWVVEKYINQVDFFDYTRCFFALVQFETWFIVYRACHLRGNVSSELPNKDVIEGKGGYSTPS